MTGLDFESLICILKRRRLKRKNDSVSYFLQCHVYYFFLFSILTTLREHSSIQNFLHLIMKSCTMMGKTLGLSGFNSNDRLNLYDIPDPFYLSSVQ